MALIKTLSDLEDWTEYRKFVIAAFKSVKDESQFFVSKDDFDFEVKGKPWAGRVALFGDKGSATMAALKREGMQFRSGTCTEQDGDLQVTGISGALLKIVNKTFKKLPVSGKAVVAGQVEDDPASASGSDQKDAEATKQLKVAAADASSAAKLKAKLKAKKSGLRSDLTEAIAKKPTNHGAIVKLVKKAGEQEKAGELQEALDSLVALEAEIARAGSAGGAVPDNAANASAADDDADAGVLKDTAAKQKADLVKRAKKLLAEDPSHREPITLILKEASRHEKKADYDAQIEQYEQLEDLLESVSPTDDEDEDIELTSIENWQEYRKWVRVRFKRLPKDAVAAEPFYISRKKMAFDLGGRQWRGHAVVAGKKARSLAKELKRTGLLLLQGACYAEGKVIHVSGLAGAALKAASKTLKLLKLGYTLASSATAAATDTDPRAAAYAKRRAALESKLRAVTSQRLGDTGRITSTEAYMQEAADGGDWTKATASLGNLERLVSEAEVGPAETDVIGAGLVAYRTSLLKFEQAKAMAEAQLKALKNGIDGVPDQGDLVDALSGELTKLFGDIKDVVDTALSGLDDEAEPLTAAVRSELDRAHQQIGAHALLNHIEMSPWGVSVKKPLLAALTGIRNAMPA
ncbi:MAG: hypothetical protein ACI8UD_000038 [Planctomycetota bacterium]|jgi:hypothetical protein